MKKTTTLKSTSLLTLLFCLLLWPGFLPASAQQPNAKTERTIRLGGTLRDNFTGYAVEGARIQVFREDGSVFLDSVKTQSVSVGVQSGKSLTMFAIQFPRHDGRYRIHVECKGYQTLDYWYTVKIIGRQNHLKGLNLALQRDFKTNKDLQLGEAVVTATKIKMFYKGDTIVYNADAFNLPEGSMLDGLIRQLPGAQLKENGEIYINGRKVDYLLLNGKNFYKGNNKIMLDNLPYYTVKQLKVYEKSTERSKALGHDVEEKDYVMDVNLKKEYATGYMGNVQASAGTHDRYLARLFGLRFTDFSRLSVFASSNNINESRRPGADTDWRPTGGTIGTELRHQAGVDLYVEDRDGVWDENGNATVSWNKTENESRTASETFLNGSNVFSRSWNSSTDRNLNAQLYNNFTLYKPFHLDFRTNLTYNRTDRLGASQSQGFNTHPDSLNADTLNASHNRWTGDGWNLSASQSVGFLRSLIWGDDIEAGADFRYHKSVADDFSRYDVNYAEQPEADDRRHRYDDTDRHGYEYHANLLYRFNFDRIHWELNWQFRHSRTYDHQARYRLDQVDGWTESDPLEWLPSTTSLLLQGLDNQNSRYTDDRLQEHTVGTKLSLPVFGNTLELNYQFARQHERYHYDHALLDTVMYRTKGLHNLRLTYGIGKKYESGWNGNYQFHYTMRQTAPDMEQLVPISNTYNPLAIVTGNPNLKDLLVQDVGLNLNFSNYKRNNAFLFAAVGYGSYRNNVAMATRYNRETGVYTYQPENVNGNKVMYSALRYESRFLKSKKLMVRNALAYNFNHNVDLMQTNEPDVVALSKVNTHRIEEKLEVSYDFRQLTLGAMAQIKHNRATSHRPDFTTVRANDIAYGINANWRLPWSLQLATDLKMYSRRGYGDASMNTNDLVWNASLSRAFLKGRLTTTLQGFDLLHNLSNVTYAINGQGRTETWNRSIPSYFMFHLQWKFQKNPKKR